MTDRNHAPLPWSQYAGGTQIYGGDRYFIGVVQSKNAEEDTAFIVKACNAYYDNEANILAKDSELERLRRECRDGLDALSDIDDFWEACPYPGTESTFLQQSRFPASIPS